MAFIKIPGLLFQGKEVGYDDATVVSTPPPAPAPKPVVAVSVPVGMVTLEDATFLWRANSFYRDTLKALPGSHQLFFDILTNNKGQYWSDAIPTPLGSVNDPVLKNQINTLINMGAGGPLTVTYNNYNGPLRAIYNNLVQKKLGKL